MISRKDFYVDIKGYDKIKKCKLCGRTIFRNRKSKFINKTLNLEYYFCDGKCKGKWIDENARLD